MVTEKYRLHSKARDGAQCAFFLSPKGCRNGSSCKFLHTNPNVGNDVAKGLNLSSNTILNADVSSESSGENAPIFVPSAVAFGSTAKKQVQEPVSSDKKRKNPSSNTENNNQSSLFASTKRHNNATKHTQPSGDNIQKSSAEKFSPTPSAHHQPKRSTETTNQNGGVTQSTSSNHAIAPELQDASLFVSPVEKKLKLSAIVKEEKPTNAPIVSNHTNFRQLAFPITSFSTVKKEVLPSAPNSTKHKSINVSDDGGSEEDTPFFFPPLPLPKAPESIQWKDACLKSQSHVKYHSSYSFDKYKLFEAENDIPGTWIKAKPYGSWCRTNPQVVAIDCEMCETTCPLTGKIDGKALCRLSVVNASNPEDILLDTLVKPDWPISDCRTRIHGIHSSNLESVQFTLKHAQTFMMALCSEETVIVGHAVHNDLVALKMEHYCIADSSFLFEIKDEPGVCPSLRDVAMRILSIEMPEVHDSVNDARISLQCLEEGYIKTGGNPNAIERYYPLKERNKSNSDSSLLVHRIPKICKVNHVQQLFLSQTSIQPQDIPEIEFVADKGKVNVTFQSPAHAKLAFEFIAGAESRDKGGKLQKKVYLKNGDYIVVRENCTPKPTE